MFPTLRSYLFAALLALLARPVLADDWLAALELPERAPAALGLVYPRVALPAFVAAGDVLVVRVQLPAALTPPPGVQQEGSLAGFAAELIGDGLALSGDAPPHRHRLALLAVRPEESATLLYRMRLVVPAFVAPGSYELRVRTPFGARRAARSVRVAPPGARPRLAGCPPPSAADQELASLPVDIWVCADAAPPPGAASGLMRQPSLQLSAAGACALRMGAELWQLGAPAHAQAEFERELHAVAAAEHKQLRRVGASELEATFIAIDPGEPSALRIERQPGAFALDARAAKLERTLPLLLPAAARWRYPSGTLQLYPASDLGLHQVRDVLGLVRVSQASALRVEVSPFERTPPSFELEPIRARSGARTRVRVERAPADARVAFEYGLGKSGLSGPEFFASFAGPLEAPVRALVLPREGGAQLLRARAWVEPSRPPNCAASPFYRRARVADLALLFALAILLKRRSSRRLGNRLGPAVRSEHRDGAKQLSLP